MENYEGAIGSITASVLKVGLKPTTTIQLIVRRCPHRISNLPVDLMRYQAVDDIGHVAAGVFQVYIVLQVFSSSHLN